MAVKKREQKQATKRSVAQNGGSSDNEDQVKTQKASSKRQKKAMVDKKSRAETDLEMLVFGGEDEDVMNNVFGKMVSNLPAASKDSDSDQDESEESGSENEEDEPEAESKGEDEEMAEEMVEDSIEGGDDSLFFVDTVLDKNSGDEDESESESESDSDESQSEDEQDTAAWVDEDTQQATVALKSKARSRKLRETEGENEVAGDVYEERLRQQFQKINPVPKWADKAEINAWDDSDKEDDTVGGDLLNTTAPLISKSSTLLAPTKLDTIRLRNANQMAPSQSAISSIQFHPTSSVLLTAGLDKTLRLFEVDGKDNQKIQSIYFKDLPITSAQFIRGGQEVVVSGKRGWYYSVDIEKSAVTRISGIPGYKMKSLEFMHSSTTSDRLAFMSNGGQIHLVSAQTKQFIHTLPMNGAVRDVAFTADGNYLWSTGLDNEVYQWDLRQNRCLSRWHDSATFRPTCLSVSPDTSYYASGDNAGVVNIYDTNVVKDKRVGASGAFYNVNAFKSINNLTTSIQGLKFNHSSEILGIYSRRKADQLKLVHLPSGTVFSNWPSSKSHLGHVQCMDFSPNSGFMAIGNDGGKALLYRLPHYQNY
ncbi:WD40-repeat-containing domain protein [Kickxella alabastrina]|uniref:WD40-repeat-containing domain protein n=1 Tax=Kickxella alabastrina TaxID=61397 RepID=UPI002220CE38|nr:WD40-repeat-containing domain protein [Kickxella alabastrina]KAI7829243.1 WD40-repeat-containing domain protein [Kickxella alabastrina]